MSVVSNPPKFSVIILHWRSEHTLSRCLDALSKQSFRDFEVLLLDNGSDVPLKSDFADGYPDLDLAVTRSEKNLGFAGGNNLLAGKARGDYIVLLNADAFVEPDWLTVLDEASRDHPKHFFASRLLMDAEPDKLDGEWHAYHASGLALRHGHNASLDKATDEKKEVFGACAAASAYPRVAFESLGGFDEDFFAYMEDIDLDFRLQLEGWRCMYLPQAVARHVGSASSAPRSDFAVFHGQRNLIWVFFKNMPGALFWLLLIPHLLVNLAYLLISPFFSKAKPIAKAKWEALKGLGAIIKKRRVIQATRKVSVNQIAKLLDWNPFTPLKKLRF